MKTLPSKQNTTWMRHQNDETDVTFLFTCDIQKADSVNRIFYK